MVWYIMPSANHEAARKCCALWRDAGYKTAVAVDDGPDFDGADLAIKIDYRGYPDAIRRLCLAVDAGVVVCGGDDMSPDPQTAPDLIEAQFRERFPDLFGVMQPIGDQFGGISWAAVSPWIGRGWIDRAYGGNGPYFHGYYHLHNDEELRAVAMNLGAYWERPDLTQYHAHWTRGHDDNLNPVARQRIKDRWKADRNLFRARQRDNFPGSAPLVPA